nr:MAG: hypothetical protein [Caudoviricetes sp.]
MFCLDIETLSTSSSTVILSAGLVYFDQTQTYTFEELIESACFVKFDAKEQSEKYKRKVEKSTLEWWKQQSKDVQKISLFPSASDMTAEKGIKTLKEYIRDHSKEKTEICWIRGTIDQMAIDDLCKDLDVPFLFPYYAYRDIRTALDLLKETTKKGYCKIPNFDYSKVKKHCPIQDICLDVMMLLYGE